MSTAAYACMNRVNSGKTCDRWCGDEGRRIASPVLVSARAAIEKRYTGQGEAAPHGASNPYRPGSAAATWWQRGNDGAPLADSHTVRPPTAESGGKEDGHG